MYIAHRHENGTAQPLVDHLRAVAALSGEFAQPFGAEELGKLVGMLHDLGKYSDAFVRRISGSGAKTDHATAGAQAVWNAYPKTIPAIIAAYCIMSHHTGLVNGGTTLDEDDLATLYGRLKKRVEPYGAYSSEIVFSLPNYSFCPTQRPGFASSFLIRMLFSCLVDADFLDTESFMQGDTGRGGYAPLTVLAGRMQEYLVRFENPDSPIKQKRNEILNDCLRRADEPQGVFTLTVPTGGGKTISSMAFAMKHAERHGLSRIIYVIPYTSILEQTANTFSDVFGAENVLAHYAGAPYDNDSEDGIRKHLATENWDAPVIVTTNVQFFQSLFGKRTSVCRKLHNIANSVIVFDEAQMLPQNFLRPCVEAIAELASNYRCTPILCTATQSALDTLMPPGVPIREICENPGDLYHFFRRVTYQNENSCSDDNLAARLSSAEQVLCITNTRKQAKTLFSRLSGEGSFHLSTAMYPAHRRRVLEEIRHRLSNGKPCRVVSTSLIEAGVDVDFPEVWRAEAGLDSIIQAAGRCNRENRHDASRSIVHIFSPEDGYTPPKQVKQTLSAYRSVTRKFEDIASLDAIRAYFTELFDIKSPAALDSCGILERLEQGWRKGMSFPFDDIAGQFHIIEDDTIPILVPREPEAAKLAERLKQGERSREIFREMGAFCVNARPYLLDDFIATGSVSRLDAGVCVLEKLDLYDDQTGLVLNLPGGEAVIA